MTHMGRPIYMTSDLIHVSDLYTAAIRECPLGGIHEGSTNIEILIMQEFSEWQRQVIILRVVGSPQQNCS